MVRADSAVFGGPSSSPRLDSISAPVLGVDHQPPADVVEVEVVAVEAGEFAPAGTGPGGGDEQDGGAGPGGGELRGVVGEGEGVLVGDPQSFGGAGGAVASAAAGADGVGGDEAFVGGVGEQQ